MVVTPSILGGTGLADPHAQVHNGRVYIFCGHDKSPKSEETWIMDRWRILSSDNLVDWTVEGDILPTDTYIGDQDHCWAGYITAKNDKFYWYFSNKNIDTGVLVADNITGPFVDVLKKPLLPQGFAPTSCYDPCLYTDEDGVSTIFFGAGKYYYVQLGDDMISTVGEPKLLPVYDKNGNHAPMGDKSTVFKHNDIFYLVSGDRYATADNLFGPYTLSATPFLGGGHNDVFEFNNRLYVCNEFHDTSIFYRGVRLLELDFDKDGRVIIPPDDKHDADQARHWDFTKTNCNWFYSDFTDVDWQQAIILPLNPAKILRSPILPGIIMYKDSTLTVTLQNPTDQPVTLDLLVTSCPKVPAFWRDHDHDITDTHQITLSATPQSQTFSFNVTTKGEKGTPLKMLRLAAVTNKPSSNILVLGMEIEEQ